MHFTPLLPSANAIVQPSEHVVGQLSAQRPSHASHKDELHRCSPSPPPYTPRGEEKASQTLIRCPSYDDIVLPSSSSSQQQQQPVDAFFSATPMSLELLVGHKLATKLTKKRHARRLARLEHVHDAWLALGVDTRIIVAQRGQLPPYFWNPPRYDAEEMNRRLKQLCL